MDKQLWADFSPQAHFFLVSQGLSDQETAIIIGMLQANDINQFLDIIEQNAQRIDRQLLETMFQLALAIPIKDIFLRVLWQARLASRYLQMPGILPPLVTEMPTEAQDVFVYMLSISLERRRLRFLQTNLEILERQLDSLEPLASSADTEQQRSAMQHYYDMLVAVIRDPRISASQWNLVDSLLRLPPTQRDATVLEQIDLFDATLLLFLQNVTAVHEIPGGAKVTFAPDLKQITQLVHYAKTQIEVENRTPEEVLAEIACRRLIAQAYQDMQSGVRVKQIVDRLLDEGRKWLQNPLFAQYIEVTKIGYRSEAERRQMRFILWNAHFIARAQDDPISLSIHRWVVEHLPELEAAHPSFEPERNLDSRRKLPRVNCDDFGKEHVADPAFETRVEEIATQWNMLDVEESGSTLISCARKCRMDLWEAKRTECIAQMPSKDQETAAFIDSLLHAKYAAPLLLNAPVPLINVIAQLNAQISEAVRLGPRGIAEQLLALKLLTETAVMESSGHDALDHEQQAILSARQVASELVRHHFASRICDAWGMGYFVSTQIDACGHPVFQDTLDQIAVQCTDYRLSNGPRVRYLALMAEAVIKAVRGIAEEQVTYVLFSWSPERFGEDPSVFFQHLDAFLFKNLMIIQSEEFIAHLRGLREEWTRKSGSLGARTIQAIIDFFQVVRQDSVEGIFRRGQSVQGISGFGGQFSEGMLFDVLAQLVFDMDRMIAPLDTEDDRLRFIRMCLGEMDVRWGNQVRVGGARFGAYSLPFASAIGADSRFALGVEFWQTLDALAVQVWNQGDIWMILNLTLLASEFAVHSPIRTYGQYWSLDEHFGEEEGTSKEQMSTEFLEYEFWQNGNPHPFEAAVQGIIVSEYSDTVGLFPLRLYGHALELARRYYQDGDFHAAIHTCEQILVSLGIVSDGKLSQKQEQEYEYRDDHVWATWCLKMDALEAMNDLLGAIRTCEQAQKYYGAKNLPIPRHVSLMCRLATLYGKAGDEKRKREHFEQALLNVKKAWEATDWTLKTIRKSGVLNGQIINDEQRTNLEANYLGLGRLVVQLQRELGQVKEAIGTAHYLRHETAPKLFSAAEIDLEIARCWDKLNNRAAVLQILHSLQESLSLHPQSTERDHWLDVLQEEEITLLERDYAAGTRILDLLEEQNRTSRYLGQVALQEAHTQYALALYATNQHDKAYVEAKEAIRYGERQRRRPIRYDQRVTISEDQAKTFEQLILSLWDSGKPEEAYGFIQRLRGQALDDWRARRSRASSPLYRYIDRRRGQLHPDLASLRNEIDSGESVPLDRVQSRIPSSAAILEYYTADNRILIFGVTADDFVSFPGESTPRELWEVLIRTVQLGLSRGKGELDVQSYLLSLFHHFLSQELFAWLIRHEVTRLFIVPHGLLHRIPLHCMNIGSIDNPEYLCERFTISYTPSAQLLRMPVNKPSAPFPSLLAVAPIPCEGSVPLYTRLTALSASILPDMQHLPSLVGKQATVEQFAHYAPYADDLILATHGHAAFGTPERFRMPLADSNLTFQQFISADKAVSGIKPGANIVCSACYTALADVKKSDELISVAAAWLGAGAGSVTTALWELEDLAASFLISYYTEGLAKRLSTAEAMQKAQQRFRTLTEEEAVEHLQRLRELAHNKEESAIALAALAEVYYLYRGNLKEAQETYRRATVELEDTSSEYYTALTKGMHTLEKRADMGQHAEAKNGSPFAHPFYWAGIIPYVTKLEFEPNSA